MKSLYQKVKDRAKGCRDRDVRIKVALFLLALRIGNVTEACSRRGFSRQFYYRWWRRFERSGFSLASLKEKSRRPKKQPNRTPEKVERAIRYYAGRKYGARMIEAHLKREGNGMGRSRSVDDLSYPQRPEEKPEEQASETQNAPETLRASDPGPTVAT